MNSLVLETEPAAGVAQLTLNRPEQRNALDAALIGALAAALARQTARSAIRVVLLAGAGSSFCAGADMNSMIALGRGPRAENLTDAAGLAHLLRALRESPKPVIACVHGPAFGGGVGLAAASDIAIASTAARFRLPEVQLGLVPAVISPYVIEAIGARHARRYFLSAESLSAERARDIGLVHEVVAPESLLPTALAIAAEVRQAGPEALAAAKALIAEVAAATLDARLALRTAEILATLRASGEGQEGLAAALARRAPSWRG